MIFREELAKLIMEGKKTQTRRPMKHTDIIWDRGEGDAETGEVVRVSIDNGLNTTRFAIGREVAVQPGRGKKPLGRIKIKEILYEGLSEIDLDGAKAEGFESVEEFFKTWRELYGEEADLEAEVWVVSFEVVK